MKHTVELNPFLSILSKEFECWYWIGSPEWGKIINVKFLGCYWKKWKIMQ